MAPAGMARPVVGLMLQPGDMLSLAAVVDG